MIIKLMGAKIWETFLIGGENMGDIFDFDFVNI